MWLMMVFIPNCNARIDPILAFQYYVLRQIERNLDDIGCECYTVYSRLS